MFLLLRQFITAILRRVRIAHCTSLCKWFRNFSSQNILTKYYRRKMMSISGPFWAVPMLLPFAMVFKSSDNVLIESMLCLWNTKKQSENIFYLVMDLEVFCLLKFHFTTIAATDPKFELHRFSLIGLSNSMKTKPTLLLKFSWLR